MELDPPTLGADATGEGKINMGDVTKIELIILEIIILVLIDLLPWTSISLMIFTGAATAGTLASGAETGCPWANNKDMPISAIICKARQDKKIFLGIVTIILKIFMKSINF